MQLKSIEIIGFKSFAEKTKITFPSGMTGIVGPNGSGKSNIAEAIRWVLGEQSAKNLRGSKMPDIIFSGSADRRALNMAAVTLIFDNQDHYLDRPFSEIKVSRKLFRNGDSSYFLNEKQCRLKDITNLFMDTGIGQGSLSIISQGNVEAIFNSKPVDRRSIIENVAGVYKYKQQKSTAENEIVQTADNLDRVNDIIHELEVRLDPLEEQSSQATDYLDQKKRLDKLEKQQLILSAQTNQQTVQQVKNQLKQADKLVTRLTAELAETNQLTQKAKQSLNDRREKIEIFNQRLLKIAEKMAHLKSQQQLSSQKTSFKNEDLERNQGQLQDVERQITDLKKKQADLLSQADKINVALKTDQTALASVNQQIAANNIPAIEKRINQLRDRYVDLLQDQTKIKNQLTVKQQDQQRYQDQQRAQKERIRQAESRLSQLAESETSKQQLIQVQKERLLTDQHKLDQLKAQLNKKSALVDERQSDWLSALKIAEQAKAKAHSLQNLHDSYRSFYRGTANLLQHRDQLNGIFGPVSDYLKIKPEYVKAIETSLGGQAQHIIVTDNRAASSAIEFMTKNRYGRVTLLPVSTIQARHLDTRVTATAQQVTGFVGVASDLVVMPTKFSAIKQFLLGTTLIATTLEAAIKISQTIQHRTRIVSLDGQVVNAGGSLTGGANKANNQGVLIQKAELEKLAAVTSEMDQKLAEREQSLQAAKTALNDIQESYNRGKQVVFQANQKLQSQREELTSLQVEHDQRNRELKTLKLTFNNALMASETSDGNNLTANRERVTSELQAVSDELAQKQDQLGNVKKLADKYQDQKLTIHERIVVGQQKAQRCQDDQQEAARQLDKLNQQRQQLRQRLDQLKADLNNQINSVELEKQIENEVKQQTQLTNQLAAIKDQVSADTKEYEDLQSRGQSKQLNLNNAVYEQRDLRDKLNQSQARLAKLLDQLATNYQITPDQLTNPDWNWDSESVARQIKLLRMGIDEIGPVNISAIQEFKDVSERHTFLLSQREDLLEAKNHLTSTMNQMDTTITHKFAATFKQVANAFSKVFVDMFGGGEAKLVLTDPEDMLNTGIEIMVKPPGKNYRNLSLLSGGEKALTAITLLFAIIKVSPVPFCVLDEAEAALDPFNADRFAKYLKRFGDETQFIVITHRKETMIYADQLYGITMQESGVSKVITVNLDNFKTEVS